MNYNMVIYILGWVLQFEAGFMCLPAIVGAIYGESSAIAFVIVAVASFITGRLCCIRKPKSNLVYLKEGFFVVALSWLVMGIFGALPFVISGEITSYVDALFETISGFTTTGASILNDVETMSHACLFWRCFTHWIGGMGVFVFIMAFLPLLGGNTLNLMKAESPGPSVDKLVPRIKDTAKILYGIYFGITVTEAILLFISGMDAFSSITLTFSTVGTGGFGLLNDSMASYSPAQQIIVTVFMMLNGINYGMFFLLLRRRFRQAFGMEEVRVYILIIFFAVAAISINIWDMYESGGEVVRHAAFQVGSLITTTGFATTNFDLWPEFSKSVLMLVMLIGACASSTGGGIKVSRIIIFFKSIKKEMSMLLHPRAVKKITLDGNAIQHDVVRSTNVFLALFCIILTVSVLIISADGFDFRTNFAASVATLNNIGMGMGGVGSTGNYSIFSPLSKCALMFNMLAGRLELFPVLLLIMPRSWKRNA